MNTIQPRTRDAVLFIARMQLGVMETPANSNKQKYGEAYGMNGVYWCMQFVWWVFREAGFNLYKTASCGELMRRYQKADPTKKSGCWVTGHYKPGDIAIFDFPGGADTDHCGIIESVNADGTITTIEGNTSTSNDSNGGAVMRRIRKLTFVRGACRPGYNM